MYIHTYGPPLPHPHDPLPSPTPSSGGDSYQEGLAHYRIGQAYEDGGEVQLALKNYRSYFERCKVHADHEGMGKACQALAHTYEK